MPAFAKPTVLASRCLGFANCRYNGVAIASEAVQKLAHHVRFITHCPEVEIGLPVPRRPVRLVEVDGEPRMLQTETNVDFTAPMNLLAAGVFDRLPPVEGCIFKARSPSCGVGDAKLYPSKDATSTARRTAGLFAAESLRRFDAAAVEDEGRLTDYAVRERFLTRIFTLAEFRRVRRAGRMGALVRFHARHKLLMMACSQKHLRLLGGLAANREGAPFDEIAARYEAGLIELLRIGPKPGQTVNVLLHAVGYFKRTLKAAEKTHFLDLLAAFRDRRVPLSAPISVLRSWIEREDQGYLRQQSFFAPYPPELMDISDPGKGRRNHYGAASA